MKTLNLVSAALFAIISITYNASAQEWTKNLPKKKSSEFTLNDYKNAFNNYWEPKNLVKGKLITTSGETKKAPGWKQFKRWEWYMESQVDSDGNFPEKTAFEVVKEYEANRPQLKSTIGLGNWTSLGTNYSDGGYAGIGRINVVAFHPSDNDTYWVGAASGGLWVTNDNGISWTVLTDENNVLGISDIAIPGDFTTSNTIYIATGDRDGWDNRSIGVLKSTDGGVSWVPTDLSFSVSDYDMTTRLLIDPNDDNTILAATTNGVYKTSDGGTNWDTQLTTTSFIDFEYKPGDFSVLYGSTKSGEIYVSTDSGSTWTETFSTEGRRVELAVSPANGNYVYAVVSNSQNGLFGIYKSTDSGNSFSMVLDGSVAGNNVLGYYTDGSTSTGQGWYDLCIDVSPSNIDLVLVGGINTWRTVDGGTTWEAVNCWTEYYLYNTTEVQEVHADKHCLKYRANGDLFECNDGGIYFSADDGISWTDKTNGITISQLYKIGTAQSVNDEVICGLQDNGTKLYDGSDWSDVLGGDGMECIIDYSNENIQYGTLYYGDMERTLNHWSSKTNITPSGGASGAWVTPYIIDPVNPATLYAGYNNVYKTTDRGDSWSIIGSFWSSGTIRNMAIAQSDPNTIILSTSSSIWKTTDGGSNWTDLSADVPSSSSISSITVKDDDPNTIWLTYSGYNSDRVFESTNGGLNWTNISSGLPSIPVHTVVQNTLATGVELYAGTDVGVYYKSPVEDWVPYNNGLPNVIVTELEIYYDNSIPTNSRLRAATYGRGLWESDIMLDDDFPPSVSFDGGTDITATSCTLNGTIIEDFGETVTASGFLYSTSSGITWEGAGVTTVSTNPVVGEGEFNIAINGLSSATTYYVRAYATSANGTNLSDENSFSTECDGIVSSFPYNQEFSVNELPSCWTIDDLQGNGQVWVFNNPGEQTINTTTSDNGFAIIDSDHYGEGGIQNCDLISPIFDFNDFTGIQVQFEHYFYEYTGESGTFSYSTDNGNTWAVLQTWLITTSNAEVYSQDLTYLLEGESQVRFKWNYSGSYGWLWAVDDFRILADQNMEVPTNKQVSSTTIKTGIEDCFNATNTITVAGDATNVIVESGASADFIAGQNIRFLPGFHAHTGSYAHGYITTNDDYCVEVVPPVVAEESKTEKEAVILYAEEEIIQPREMTVYPNPNTGEFTVEFRNFEYEIRVMLFNSIGQLIHDETTTEQEIRLNVPNPKSGMYLVKAINKEKQFNQKILIK